MNHLENLAKYQDLILLAEIGALIHDLGKLSKEFVTKPGDEHSHLLDRDTSGNVPYHIDEADRVCTYFSIIEFHLEHDEGVKKRLSESQRQEISALAAKIRHHWRIHGGNLAQVHENLLAELSTSPTIKPIAKALPRFLEGYLAKVNSIPDEIRQAESQFADVASPGFVQALEDASFEGALQLTALADIRQAKRLGDFIALHHQTPVCPRPALIALLRAGDGGADGFDSWIDKGKVEGQPSQDPSATFIATAFGHEAQRLPVGPDEDGLKAVRDEFAQVLAEELGRVRDGQATPAQVRRRVFRAAETAFRQALGETRRAANDVTLWNHAYSVASLYKAALAKVLVEGQWTEPEKIGWRFLRVGVDGMGFFAQAHHVTDIMGRRQALTKALDRVQATLEVKYPLGNEIYRDENGSIFVMPGLADGENWQALQQEIKSLVKTMFQSELAGELKPSLLWNEPVRKEMTVAFGKLITQPTASIPDPQAMRGWWQSSQAERKEICTVCGVRPIGYGVAELYGPNKQRIRYYRQAADERKVCAVCMKRRGGRAQAWATNSDGSFGRTIWTDEVADDNGRFALVVGRFALDGWLDGRLVKTMLVARGKEKNPSPARIRRVWETTRRFWRDLIEPHNEKPPALEKAIAPADSSRPFRLRINPANAAEVRKALGAYHVYEWPLQGGITLSVVWVPDGPTSGYFVSADNLRYLAGPEQLDLPSERRERLTGLLYEFGRILNSRKEHTLWEPSGYGRPGKVQVTVRLPEEKPVEIVPGFYAPYIPILAEPATFMALVPADKALEVAKSIKKKYEQEMARVRDRLPLHLGLVFAPRRTPLAAVLDAGRAMLEIPDEWEKWEIKATGREATFSRNGHSFRWKYPPSMGDGQTPDIWYPHLLAVNPKDKKELRLEDGGFALVDNLTGPVWIRPSRFDFEFLDTTARRFEIHYDDAGRRPARPSRPFSLDDLDRLEEIWEEMRRLEKSQRHQVIAAIEATREAWFGTDWQKSWADEVFIQFVGDTLAGAAWPQGRKWADLNDETRKKLKDAGVRGELADLAELHQEIMKEKEKEKGREKEHGDL